MKTHRGMTPLAALRVLSTVLAASFAIAGTPAMAQQSTIWPQSAVPAIASADDPRSIEVGVKFRADTAGRILAIRFYKGPNNTGTHIGNLWGVDGTLLASAVFTGETASGWQQVNLPSPVSIQANATYVASYFTSSGGYAATSGEFATQGVNNPSTARAQQ